MSNVLELTLKRKWLTLLSTIGELFIGAVFQCFILEDRYRPPPEPKVPGETCIPVGRYEVVWTESPKFGRKTLRLLDVPQFSGILIHGGNDPKDSLGCLLTGTERAENHVNHSLAALKALEAKLVPFLEVPGNRCFINIVLEPS